MKKLLIFLSLIIAIYLIGTLALNSHTVQDRILNIGLKNIISNSEPFLDKEDSLKVVICGSRSPLPSPGRAESLSLIHI